MSPNPAELTSSISEELLSVRAIEDEVVSVCSTELAAGTRAAVVLLSLTDILRSAGVRVSTSRLT